MVTNMVDINLTVSIITLNSGGVNIPINIDCQNESTKDNCMLSTRNPI